MAFPLPSARSELDQFVYIVSHDFNAPLRHIRAFSDLLIKHMGDKADEEEREYIRYIEMSVHRCEAMMAALLEYSRINTQAGDMHPIDLNMMLGGVLRSFEGAIKKSNAKLHAKPLPSVMGDERQLRIMFKHLLSNAIKFHRDGIDPEINIWPEQVGNDLRIHMQDNGIGIEAQYAGPIFDLFVKLNGGSKYEGVGAGLTIAQKIAVRHGGRIEWNPAPGQGCVFTVSLPATVIS